MKINENYIMRDIAGEVIIIPTGEAAQMFNGMISTNEVAAFIWKHIETCKDANEITEKLIQEFDIDYESAYKDVVKFIQDLHAAQMIEL